MKNYTRIINGRVQHVADDLDLAARYLREAADALHNAAVAIESRDLDPLSSTSCARIAAVAADTVHAAVNSANLGHIIANAAEVDTLRVTYADN